MSTAAGRKIRNSVLRLSAVALLSAPPLPTAVAAQAPAASGGDYSIVRDVIAAGGGTLAAGPFALTSAQGEPAVGEQHGGSFSLRGGFLHAGAAPTDAIGDALFANGFEVAGRQASR